MENRIGEMVFCNPTVKLNKGEKYPVINIENIIVGNKYVYSQDAIEYNGQSSSKFSSGDTLFSRITPCLENGKIAQCRIDGNGFGSTELFVFRGIPGKTDNDYVYYLMSSKYIRDLATNSMTGASGRQRADLNFIKRIKWNFPELDEQKRIVHQLNKFDDLIDINNKKMEILNETILEIYKEWFVRFRFPEFEKETFDRGFPKRWEIRKVKDCVDRKKFGYVYKSGELEKEGLIIVIDQSKEDYLGFHNEKPSHYASLENPMLLFGDHSCKKKIMIKDFSLGENVIPYKSIDESFIDNYYLFYATNNLIETEEYKRHWSRFCGFKIFVPPIDLQLKFAEIAKKVEFEKEMLWQKNQLLSKQRDLLISNATSLI